MQFVFYELKVFGNSTKGYDKAIIAYSVRNQLRYSDNLSKCLPTRADAEGFMIRCAYILCNLLFLFPSQDNPER